MTREEALRFLRMRQPMPDDHDLSDAEISLYDDARKFFLKNPTEEAVSLFLNSFGNGNGRGVYQLVEDVITLHPPAVVVPSLVTALSSPVKSVQYWSAQISANFPHPDLIPPLEELLSKGDYDMKYAAITALEQIPEESASNVLRKALDVEPDEELREIISDALLK